MGPVKDFVRDVWKIAAACAGAALLLSLVIGLIAGNPFGIAFSRAILLAAVFAALGAGLRFLVKAYLPELAGQGPPADGRTAAPAADHRGAAVDITLPEEDGLRRQAYGGARRDAGEETVDGEEEEALEAESLEEEGASGDGARALGELEEELAEELPSAAPASRPPAEKDEPEAELPGSTLETAGDLDSLPDISALEPLAGQRPGPSLSSRGTPSGERPADAVREILGGQDPSTLARAIRTALKKDEKG
jgi:hypothetical protein